MSGLPLLTAFAGGLALGGGVATVISNRRVIPTYRPSETPSTLPPPVVGINGSGGPQISDIASLTSFALPVLKYGNPGPIADPLIRKAYVAAYDRRLKHPAWTAEHLTLASLKRPTESDGGNRQNSQFIEDASLPAAFRSKLSDYARSGYDRGHMVPAADAKSSQEAMNETFLLSNIAPQVGDGFNRHYWAYLEEWCRRLTNTFSDVYVFTIPMYLPRLEPDGKWRVTHEVIGSPPNVSVPTHFAKVVLTLRPVSPSKPDILELSMGAFVLPNAKIPDEASLESFVVPVDVVERAAGLTLFSDAVKSGSKHLCQTTKCQVIVRSV